VIAISADAAKEKQGGKPTGSYQEMVSVLLGKKHEKVWRVLLLVVVVVVVVLLLLLLVPLLLLRVLLLTSPPTLKVVIFLTIVLLFGVGVVMIVIMTDQVQPALLHYLGAQSPWAQTKRLILVEVVLVLFPLSLIRRMVSDGCWWWCWWWCWCCWW